MPLQLRLAAGDLVGVRFARSPLWETMEAIRTLTDPRRQAYHLSWLRAVDVAAAEPVLTTMRPLVPVRGFTPDFLTPVPEGPTTAVEDELADVAATPLDVVVRELRIGLASPHAAPHVRQGVRAMLDDPGLSLQRIVAAQRGCWELLVKPFWAAVDDLLADDIAHRAGALARGGLASVLDDLHPDVTWAWGVLHFGGGAHGFTGDLRGRGLVLMPSVFAWPAVVALTDPPWQPTIIYPARGVGTLWPPVPARGPGALGELLGGSRARLLLELAVETSTSVLARRIGLGLPTTSVHLRVLRAAGLVTARRAGREVLHRRTALGATLVGEA